MPVFMKALVCWSHLKAAGHCVFADALRRLQPHVEFLGFASQIILFAATQTLACITDTYHSCQQIMDWLYDYISNMALR